MTIFPSETEPARVVQGDALDVLRVLPPGVFDAVVTDPPCGISFMGKKWDGDKGGRDKWVAWLAEIMAECLRVTKPGGRIFCWALPRTAHWTACAIEDAGWQIENKVYHLFGTGFPKGRSQLKPAAEEWVLARKPGPKVLPLGIDECRVPTRPDRPGSTPPSSVNGRRGSMAGTMGRVPYDDTKGRWPANFTHDGSPEVLAAFAAFGESGSNWRKSKGERHGVVYGGGNGPSGPDGARGHADSGTAARFFYCAKASKSERGPDNTHPTVKPIALMSHLIKLICPPGETVLDPFCGSGTTLIAALRCGRLALGIDNDAEPGAVEMARRRVKAATGLLGV